MSEKSTKKAPAKPAVLALRVRSRHHRRYRAGLEFGRDWREVSVSEAQAAEIAADAELEVEEA